ncbi:hypothetical protein Tco_0090417 [Tanacetum coccineum]
MFLKYSTSQIPPKKRKGKGSQGKKTVDTPVADVDVSRESDFEPARKRTASRRVVNKKVTISVSDNIIPDLDVALELGKSISLIEAAEEEAACKVSATSKGLYYASSQRKQENQQKTARSSDEEVDLIDFDEDEEKKDDDDDDKSIDLEKIDDEETDDEFVHSVNEDEDEEMTNAEVEDSGKGDAEIFDVAKANAKKIKEIKDDAKKAELPPTSSNLSVSIGFGDQFLKISSDTSLLDLIQKYSMKPTPDSSKIQKPTVDPEQESKKTASEIHKVKKELAEKQKMLKYSIKSTNKAALKETPLAGPTQGKAPSKGSKTGKFASVKEPVEEPIAEVVMDDVFNNAGEDVVSDDDQPQDTSELKTDKTPNPEWFKQPPKPPTPNPEWNKHQVHNVYSTQKILGVKSVSVKKLNGYGHLEEVVVKRDNRQLYKFKEGDFIDLHLNDIEDML